jgi:hypothetical protein
MLRERISCRRDGLRCAGNLWDTQAVREAMRPASPEEKTRPQPGGAGLQPDQTVIQPMPHGTVKGGESDPECEGVDRAWKRSTESAAAS